jgi:soluble lytic murein transglycosylase-like protein
MRRTLRANTGCALAAAALAWIFACNSTALGDEQRDPELKALLQKIIGTSDCFADKYDSVVWYKAMEPRLAQFVPTHEARIEILDHVYCEAKRDPTLEIPPDLVLALMEVESRFDRYAVSPAGAVGLMQVMPFWPRELGVQNQLVKVAPNIRMGCEILRYYVRAEHRNWTRALARYNGSVGRNTYPALVMQRWQRTWRY